MKIQVRCWDGNDMISPDYVSRDGTAWWKENGIPVSSAETMLYTGLKDKDGIHIFEGDIVKVYWMAEFGFTAIEFEENAVIIFDDCNFIAKLIEPISIGVCEEGFYEENAHELTKLSHDEEVNLTFQVVGNIHENPEFLLDKIED